MLAACLIGAYALVFLGVAIFSLDLRFKKDYLEYIICIQRRNFDLTILCSLVSLLLMIIAVMSAASSK